MHYREHAIALGVPAAVISIETQATNTSQNLTNSRQILAEAGVQPKSVMLISRPPAAASLCDLPQGVA